MFQIKSLPADHSFDAIVIGSGMTGGWAAKEFCDAGFRTLVIERGKNVKHGDYPTATKNPWDFAHRGRMPRENIAVNPIVSKCYAYGEATEHFFVKDSDHPYIQEKPFDWIRGYQVGGKSLLWARQTQRWSDYEFEAPARDGYATDWPIRYKDLEYWYSHVEKFVGICGDRDGIENLPDSEVLPGFELNCVEKDIQAALHKRYNMQRRVIIGRCAHLTEPQQIHLDQGRGRCQRRTLCERGCPYGGYYSSVSSTLPWAARTGHLTLLPDHVVHSIIYDDNTNKAIGVKVVNQHTKEESEYHAKVIFLNAATLNSNLVLLNSQSSRFPKGLGNDHDLLGRYIAFHNYRGNVDATVDGYLDKYHYGRRPTQAIMPSFKNVKKNDSPFLGGYMSYFIAYRSGWGKDYSQAGIGDELKAKMTDPGPWAVSFGMQGETIPLHENQISLDDNQKDQWGVPLLKINVGYADNDIKMKDDFMLEAAEMLDAAGCKNIKTWDNVNWNPGLDIHEMGGVRMGHDPKTSMLNKWNQLHACKNVFVTDGACMSSVGNQNPSLTFMALTARAANHAIDELKKGNL